MACQVRVALPAEVLDGASERQQNAAFQAALLQLGLPRWTDVPPRAASYLHHEQKLPVALQRLLRQSLPSTSVDWHEKIEQYRAVSHLSLSDALEIVENAAKIPALQTGLLALAQRRRMLTHKHARLAACPPPRHVEVLPAMEDCSITPGCNLRGLLDRFATASGAKLLLPGRLMGFVGQTALGDVDVSHLVRSFLTNQDVPLPTVLLLALSLAEPLALLGALRQSMQLGSASLSESVPNLTAATISAWDGWEPALPIVLTSATTRTTRGVEIDKEESVICATSTTETLFLWTNRQIHRISLTDSAHACAVAPLQPNCASFAAVGNHLYLYTAEIESGGVMVELDASTLTVVRRTTFRKGHPLWYGQSSPLFPKICAFGNQLWCTAASAERGGVAAYALALAENEFTTVKRTLRLHSAPDRILAPQQRHAAQLHRDGCQATLPLTQPFTGLTVESWICFMGAEITETAFVLEAQPKNGIFLWQIKLECTPHGLLQLTVTHRLTGSTTYNLCVPHGEWHHAAVVLEQSCAVRVIVTGRGRSPVTAVHHGWVSRLTPAQLTEDAANLSLKIGTGSVRLHELRLWRTARSGFDISQTAYSRGVPPQARAGLLGYWSLEPRPMRSKLLDRIGGNHFQAAEPLQLFRAPDFLFDARDHLSENMAGDNALANLVNWCEARVEMIGGQLVVIEPGEGACYVFSLSTGRLLRQSGIQHLPQEPFCFTNAQSPTMLTIAKEDSDPTRITITEHRFEDTARAAASMVAAGNFVELLRAEPTSSSGVVVTTLLRIVEAISEVAALDSAELPVDFIPLVLDLRPDMLVALLDAIGTGAADIAKSKKEIPTMHWDFHRLLLRLLVVHLTKIRPKEGSRAVLQFPDVDVTAVFHSLCDVMNGLVDDEQEEWALRAGEAVQQLLATVFTEEQLRDLLLRCLLDHSPGVAYQRGDVVVLSACLELLSERDTALVAWTPFTADPARTPLLCEATGRLVDLLLNSFSADARTKGLAQSGLAFLEGFLHHLRSLPNGEGLTMQYIESIVGKVSELLRGTNDEAHPAQLSIPDGLWSMLLACVDALSFVRPSEDLYAKVVTLWETVQAAAPRDRVLPCTRAIGEHSVEFETPHPCEAGHTWQVCVPGAILLRITFDGQCQLRDGAILTIHASGASGPRDAITIDRVDPTTPVVVSGCDTLTVQLTAGKGGSSWGISARVAAEVPILTIIPDSCTELQLHLALLCAEWVGKLIEESFQNEPQKAEWNADWLAPTSLLRGGLISASQVPPVPKGRRESLPASDELTVRRVSQGEGPEWGEFNDALKTNMLFKSSQRQADIESAVRLVCAALLRHTGFAFFGEGQQLAIKQEIITVLRSTSTTSLLFHIRKLLQSSHEDGDTRQDEFPAFIDRASFLALQIKAVASFSDAQPSSPDSVTLAKTYSSELRSGRSANRRLWRMLANGDSSATEFTTAVQEILRFILDSRVLVSDLTSALELQRNIAASRTTALRMASTLLSNQALDVVFVSTTDPNCKVHLWDTMVQVALAPLVRGRQRHFRDGCEVCGIKEEAELVRELQHVLRAILRTVCPQPNTTRQHLPSVLLLLARLLREPWTGRDFALLCSAGIAERVVELAFNFAGDEDGHSAPVSNALVPAPGRSTQAIKVDVAGRGVQWTTDCAPEHFVNAAIGMRSWKISPDSHTVHYFEVAVRFLGSSLIVGLSRVETESSELRREAVAAVTNDPNQPICKAIGSEKSCAVGPQICTGDIIGCGLVTATGKVFFTLNGNYLGTPFTLPQNTEWTPVVGSASNNTAVFANFGHSPFTFHPDLVSHLDGRLHIPAEPTQPVVTRAISESLKHLLLRANLASEQAAQSGGEVALFGTDSEGAEDAQRFLRSTGLVAARLLRKHVEMFPVVRPWHPCFDLLGLVLRYEDDTSRKKSELNEALPELVAAAISAVKKGGEDSSLLAQRLLNMCQHLATNLSPTVAEELHKLVVAGFPYAGGTGEVPGALQIASAAARLLRSALSTPAGLPLHSVIADNILRVSSSEALQSLALPPPAVWQGALAWLTVLSGQGGLCFGVPCKITLGNDCNADEWHASSDGIVEQSSPSDPHCGVIASDGNVHYMREDCVKALPDTPGSIDGVIARAVIQLLDASLELLSTTTASGVRRFLHYVISRGLAVVSAHAQVFFALDQSKLPSLAKVIFRMAGSALHLGDRQASVEVLEERYLILCAMLNAERGQHRSALFSQRWVSFPESTANLTRVGIETVWESPPAGFAWQVGTRVRIKPDIQHARAGQNAEVVEVLAEACRVKFVDGQVFQAALGTMFVELERPIELSVAPLPELRSPWDDHWENYLQTPVRFVALSDVAAHCIARGGCAVAWEEEKAGTPHAVSANVSVKGSDPVCFDVLIEEWRHIESEICAGLLTTQETTANLHTTLPAGFIGVKSGRLGNDDCKWKQGDRITVTLAGGNAIFHLNGETISQQPVDTSQGYVFVVALAPATDWHGVQLSEARTLISLTDATDVSANGVDLRVVIPPPEETPSRSVSPPRVTDDVPLPQLERLTEMGFSMRAARRAWQRAREQVGDGEAALTLAIEILFTEGDTGEEEEPQRAEDPATPSSQGEPEAPTDDIPTEAEPSQTHPRAYEEAVLNLRRGEVYHNRFKFWHECFATTSRESLEALADDISVNLIGIYCRRIIQLCLRQACATSAAEVVVKDLNPHFLAALATYSLLGQFSEQEEDEFRRDLATVCTQSNECLEAVLRGCACLLSGSFPGYCLVDNEDPFTDVTTLHRPELGISFLQLTPTTAERFIVVVDRLPPDGQLEFFAGPFHTEYATIETLGAHELEISNSSLWLRKPEGKFRVHVLPKFSRAQHQDLRATIVTLGLRLAHLLLSCIRDRPAVWARIIEPTVLAVRQTTQSRRRCALELLALILQQAPTRVLFEGTANFDFSVMRPCNDLFEQQLASRGPLLAPLVDVYVLIHRLALLTSYDKPLLPMVSRSLQSIKVGSKKHATITTESNVIRRRYSEERSPKHAVCMLEIGPHTRQFQFIYTAEPLDFIFGVHRGNSLEDRLSTVFIQAQHNGLYSVAISEERITVRPPSGEVRSGGWVSQWNTKLAFALQKGARIEIVCETPPPWDALVALHDIAESTRAIRESPTVGHQNDPRNHLQSALLHGCALPLELSRPGGPIWDGPSSVVPVGPGRWYFEVTGLQAYGRHEQYVGWAAFVDGVLQTWTISSSGQLTVATGGAPTELTGRHSPRSRDRDRDRDREKDRTADQPTLQATSVDCTAPGTFLRFPELDVEGLTDGTPTWDSGRCHQRINVDGRLALAQADGPLNVFLRWPPGCRCLAFESRGDNKNFYFGERRPGGPNELTATPETRFVEGDRPRAAYKVKISGREIKVFGAGEVRSFTFSGDVNNLYFTLFANTKILIVPSAGSFTERVGCLLDTATGCIAFSLEGRLLSPWHTGLQVQNGNVIPYFNLWKGELIFEASQLRHLPLGYQPIPYSTFQNRARVVYRALASRIPQPPPLQLADAVRKAAEALGTAGDEIIGSACYPLELLVCLDMYLRQCMRSQRGESSPSTPSYGSAIATFVLDPQNAAAESLRGTRLALPPPLAELAKTGSGPHPFVEVAQQLRVLRALLHSLLPFVAAICQQPSSQAAQGPLLSAWLQLKQLADSRVLVHSTLRQLARTGLQPRIDLNQLRALHWRGRATGWRHSLFMQVHRQLSSYDPKELFCASKNFWMTRYEGFGGVDQGGPFRQSVTELGEELSSEQCPLFMPNMNKRRSDMGTEREGERDGEGGAYGLIPAPSATAPSEMSQYERIGHLMAGCMVTESDVKLGIDLAPPVWKQLVGTPLSIEDIRDIDNRLYAELVHLLHAEPNEGAEEDADTASLGAGIEQWYWPANSSQPSVEVRLSDGSTSQVQLEEAFEPTNPVHINAIVQARLYESEKQVAAIRKGIAAIIPASVLLLLNWHDLELMVSGSPDLPVSRLKDCVKFQPSNQKEREEQFWQVMSKMSLAQRSNWCKFCTGLRRLPLRFTVHWQDTEDRLPTAQTCNRDVYLSRYPSTERMLARLNTAVEHTGSGIDMEQEVHADVVVDLGEDETGRSADE